MGTYVYTNISYKDIMNTSLVELILIRLHASEIEKEISKQIEKGSS